MATIASLRITTQALDLAEDIRRVGASIRETHDAIAAGLEQATRAFTPILTIRPFGGPADRPLFGGLVASPKEV